MSGAYLSRVSKETADAADQATIPREKNQVKTMKYDWVGVPFESNAVLFDYIGTFMRLLANERP